MSEVYKMNFCVSKIVFLKSLESCHWGVICLKLVIYAGYRFVIYELGK